jgi:hypothetical protein
MNSPKLLIYKFLYLALNINKIIKKKNDSLRTKLVPFNCLLLQTKILNISTLKTKKFTALAILGVLIASCSVIDSLLTFKLSNQTSFTIASDFPLNSPSEIVTPDVTTNSSTDFENNNTKADLVKDVRLDELKLTITNPTDKTFSFLKSIHIFISTDDNDEIELAYLDNINSTSNNIDLICTAEKLDKYIKASSYKLRVKATTGETLTKDITIRSDMKFQVTADPFK